MKHPDLIDFIERWVRLRNFPEDETHMLSIFNRIESVDNAPVMSVLYEIAKLQNIDLDFDMISKESTDVQQYITELLSPYIDNDTFFKELIDALLLHKKYLYHPDLQQNRYYGALIQIDQYLTHKQIPVVHCLGRDSWYPSWFKFTSGIIDKELQKFHGSKYPESSVKTPEGNIVMFEKLLELISAARSKEVIH